jgi:nucleoside 2-deoxyribosyltransferase
MKIFVAASYSSQVNYETGEVFPEYKAWLEDNLERLEKFDHTLFCALRADKYKINDADGMLAFLNDKVSAGVQTEIGMAIAQKKPVVLAHTKDVELAYFNRALVLAGQAREFIMPIIADPFTPEV